jgi:ankyrin repeat protein/ribosomal protein S13
MAAPNVFADANLVEGVAYRKLTMVTEALDSGANVNFVSPESGKTPLHIITSMGRPADNAKLVPIVTLLLSRGANPNVQNLDGMTPLMYATASENAEIMKLLLDAGADATIQQNSSNGRTALRIANEFRFADGIRLLQERQAAASASPLAGLADAVASVVASAAPRDVNKELIDAARNGNMDKVKELLGAGANVNYQDEDKLTPIMYAIVSEHLDIVKELIARGADITVANHNGATPLHLAASINDIEILKRIIDTHLAESDDLNAQDNRGNTALHHAAEGGYANAVILLLNNGARSTIRNDNRLTAYDIANSPELRALFPAPPARELPAYVSAPDPVPIEFEVMKIQLKNQKVYDFEEAEEVPMLSVLSKSNSVIFKAKESYFTLPLTTIVKAIKDGSQIRHKCKAQLEGARTPYERDVDMDHQYYYIQGIGNFLVWLDQIQQGLLQDYRIFDVEETDEELDNVASAQSVQTSPGTNRYGNPVNIVSADHCQAGTKQKVFKLIPIIFTDEAQPPPGEKRRRAEADQSEASQAADILRGLRTGGRRTWKHKNSRKGKGQKTRKRRNNRRDKGQKTMKSRK